MQRLPGAAATVTAPVVAASSSRRRRVVVASFQRTRHLRTRRIVVVVASTSSVATFGWRYFGGDIWGRCRVVVVVAASPSLPCRLAPHAQRPSSIPLSSPILLDQE